MEKMAPAGLEKVPIYIENERSRVKGIKTVGKNPPTAKTNKKQKTYIRRN